MIVDAHVHMARYQAVTESHYGLVRRVWGDRTEWMMDTYSNPDAFLQMMDEAGIDFAVILAGINPITSGMAYNEYVAEFCSKSERLIPFASVNPRICPQNPVEELEDLVKNHGFKGLKLYPTYQYYYPNDAMLYPLYAKAEELGIPVSLHMGSSVFRGARLKYANPVFLDDVAVDFPDLVLLQCHSGRPIWYREAFFLARLHANVYMEISGIPPQKLLDHFPEIERISDKVVFGSDWPGIRDIKKNIQDIQGLPMSSQAQKNILGDNAARILKIKA